jgi:hypothetical protein
VREGLFGAGAPLIEGDFLKQGVCLGIGRGEREKDEQQLAEN